MPMIYISNKTVKILEKILNHISRQTKFGRIIKADIIHEALKQYARELGLKDVE